MKPQRREPNQLKVNTQEIASIPQKKIGRGIGYTQSLIRRKESLLSRHIG